MSRPVPVPLPLLILAFAAVFLLTSCRGLPVSPRAAGVVPSDPSPGGDVTPAPWEVLSQVPAVAGLRSEVRGDSLYVVGLLGPSATGQQASYDPSRPGGWMLQLFMNTDQAATGYPWYGIDYLVRGGERLPDGSFVVRRVVPNSDDPGGWGPESGAARLAASTRSFVIAVPLSAIGGDDGRLDFVLETYSTVACPECVGGIRHEWAAAYAVSGTSGTGGAIAASADRGFEVQRLAAARPLPRGPRSSDTDARW